VAQQHELPLDEYHRAESRLVGSPSRQPSSYDPPARANLARLSPAAGQG